MKFEYRTCFNEEGKWDDWEPSTSGVVDLIVVFFSQGAKKVTIKYPTFKIQYRRVEQ